MAQVLNGIEPVLSRHITEFKVMVRTGSELKRRKRLNPNRTGAVQYRDSSPEQLAKANVFDSYLYCSACVRTGTAFGLSTSRLTCLWLV